MDSSSNPASASLLRALTSRGWCFRDSERIEGLITAQLLSGGGLCTVDSIESELLNMDLRSIGGKSLPEPSALCKASHIRGPMVLQVSSCRDITRSCIGETTGSSGNRRLLLLKLSDGHSEANAVELSYVPSLHEDIIPGTKVQLLNKADVCSGVVCLNSKVIIILGGVVQSLHEEWQMKRKYLVDSHHSVKLSRENASSYPPPFEKLQIQAPKQGITRFSGSSSNEKGQRLAGKDGSSNSTLSNNDLNVDCGTDVNLLHNVDKEAEKPTSALTRPKVTASVPVQNQVAAQKLLQKSTQPNHNSRNTKSHRYRGKGKQEESAFLTLDEWEKRKTGNDLQTSSECCGINQDEDLARQLQQQLDLEDIQQQRSSYVTDAENIKMSMFNFERDGPRAAGSDEFRGTGRGRGRGRGRGSRGRGRIPH